MPLFPLSPPNLCTSLFFTANSNMFFFFSCPLALYSGNDNPGKAYHWLFRFRISPHKARGCSRGGHRVRRGGDVRLVQEACWPSSQDQHQARAAGGPADGPVPAEASASPVSGSGAGTTLQSWPSLDKGAGLLSSCMDQSQPQGSRDVALDAVKSVGTGQYPKRDTAELSDADVPGGWRVRAPSWGGVLSAAAASTHTPPLLSPAGIHTRGSVTTGCPVCVFTASFCRCVKAPWVTSLLHHLPPCPSML